MPRLEVCVGPNRFETELAWVNYTSRPTEIDTPLFAGRVLVLIRDFAGVTPDGSPPKRDAPYFEGRSRKFSILIEGRFKAREGVKPYTGDEVQFGSDFDYLPDSFPMAPFNAGMKIAKWIDPATHYEFRPPHGRPYIMSPYAACMNTFAAYPAPDALSRAIVLSHRDAQHPHHDGPEEGSFVPTEAMNDKHKWIERPHWSFLGLKGDPRVDDFLASHSSLVLPPPSSGASLHPAIETSARPGLSQRSSSLALGTLPQSSIPARSDSPPPFAAESGGVGFWGAPIPRQDDSGTSTPASSAAEDTPKKKKGSRFSLASLRHALDTSSSSSTDGAHDHITTADQLLAPGASAGMRDRAQSVGSAYKPNADVLKQLGPWRFADESVDAAEDTNFVFLDPDHPRSVAQRRKHFCRDDGRHCKEFVYDPDVIYAASFFAPFCDLNTLDIKMGPVGINVAEYFTKMPIRYTLRSTRLAPRPDGSEGPPEEEVFATISFRLVD
ncbi:DUF1769 domain-containing protein [Rhodotorula paludigena]|uniref:DUF1769 domain-containing protein n=1 Tax=Rhodotorula paludigena TaxID=86838 RepID=UPI00317B2C4D